MRSSSRIRRGATLKSARVHEQDHYQGACAGGRRASVGALAGPGATEAERSDHLGRRHRLLERQCLQPGDDGLQDAQHRSHREGRRALHRLVRAAELHRRTRRLHHRPVAVPHRPAEGRPARRQGRAAGARRHDRRSAQGAGLHDRAVRQEPPRRSRRAPADRARLPGVHGFAVPPERRRRARARGLLQGARICARSTARAA